MLPLLRRKLGYMVQGRVATNTPTRKSTKYSLGENWMFMMNPWSTEWPGGEHVAHAWSTRRAWTTEYVNRVQWPEGTSRCWWSYFTFLLYVSLTGEDQHLFANRKERILWPLNSMCQRVFSKLVDLSNFIGPKIFNCILLRRWLSIVKNRQNTSWSNKGECLDQHGLLAARTVWGMWSPTKQREKRVSGWSDDRCVQLTLEPAPLSVLRPFRGCVVWFCFLGGSTMSSQISHTHGDFLLLMNAWT